MTETQSSPLVAARTIYRGEALAAQATGEVGEVRLRLSRSLFWLSLLLLVVMTGLIYRALTHSITFAHAENCGAAQTNLERPKSDADTCDGTPPRTVQPVADIVSRLKRP